MMYRVGVECEGKHLIIARKSGWRVVECGPLKIQSGQSNVGVSCEAKRCPMRRTPAPSADQLQAQTQEELGHLNRPPDFSSFLQRFQHTDQAMAAYTKELAEPKATTAAEIHVQVVMDGMRFILPGEPGYPENPDDLPVYG